MGEVKKVQAPSQQQPQQQQPQPAGQVDPKKVVDHLKKHIGNLTEENAILRAMLEEKGVKL